MQPMNIFFYVCVVMASSSYTTGSPRCFPIYDTSIYFCPLSSSAESCMFVCVCRSEKVKKELKERLLKVRGQAALDKVSVKTVVFVSIKPYIMLLCGGLLSEYSIFPLCTCSSLKNVYIMIRRKHCEWCKMSSV